MRTAKTKSVCDARTAGGYDGQPGSVVNVEPAGDAARRPSLSAGTASSRAAESLARPWRSAPVAFVQRTDDNVLHWSVVEVDAATVPGARGSHCLVFTREDCVRRVRDYPADRQTLDDEELAALSWHR